MIPSTSSFSINRALAFGRLYQPTLGRMMVIYPAVTLILSIVTFLLGVSKVGVPFIALVSLCVTFMLYLSPLVFVAGGDPVIETMLPAKGSEKAWFMIVCSLIMFPLLVWVPQALVEWVIKDFFPAFYERNSLCEVKSQLGVNAGVISYAQVLVPTATCLYVVARERRRKIVTPVIWTLVSTVGLAILGIVVAFTKFFNIGLNHARSGLDPYEAEEVSELVRQQLIPIMNIMAVCCLIYILIMAYLSYRKISNRQI